MEKSPIVFLAVPDSLKSELRRFSNRFKIDPSIPLPIEVEDRDEKIEGAVLSLETLLSGMLRVIAASGGSGTTAMSISETPNVPSEWLEYYRGFVLTVKPEIYHEFTSASIVKAENGEFDMALEISAVLEGLFPLSPGVLLNKALILEAIAGELERNGRSAVNENARALEAYETAMALKPVLPDTLFNAAFFFKRQRNFARAADCFSRYIAIADETAEDSREKVREARKILREIGGLDEDSFREAYDLINMGEDERGMARIREYIEKHPKVWNGWFLLGWALRKQGRFNDSLAALKKALELGGEGGDLKNEMAICYMENGDYKAARKELTEALRETSNDIKIISNLGVLALKTGDRDKAASYFRTVLELDSSDPLAQYFFDEEKGVKS